MVSVWNRKSSSTYNFRKLIDSQVFEDGENHSNLHVICDIDKTYLETSFESTMQLVRIAFENAADKITVQGASDVLKAIRWAQGIVNGSHKVQPIHFVSSSPPQIRGVLEEKLALDGLEWTSDTFKNQAYNIRKGRMDQLKQHVVYKSGAILNLFRQAKDGSGFFLIGDNAEYDGYIYQGLRLLLDGKLSLKGYGEYLTYTGIDQGVANDFSQAIGELPKVKVRGVLIRNAPGYVFTLVPPLTSDIFVFDQFFECALYLIFKGLIPGEALWSLTRSFHNQHGFSRSELAENLVQFSHTYRLSDDLSKLFDRVLDLLLVEGDSVKSTAHENKKESSATAALDETEILKAAKEWSVHLKKKSESHGK